MQESRLIYHSSPTNIDRLASHRPAIPDLRRPIKSYLSIRPLIDGRSRDASTRAIDDGGDPSICQSTQQACQTPICGSLRSSSAVKGLDRPSGLEIAPTFRMRGERRRANTNSHFTLTEAGENLYERSEK